MVASIYKRRIKLQRRRKRFVRFIKLCLILFVIWGMGLAWFISFKPEPSSLDSQRQVDGIVALTGGVGRIEAGIEALNLRLGKRLLISGVNANLNTTTILNAYDSPLKHCENNDEQTCINLGRQALDTKGNAAETKNWAEENGFTSLMVITSDFHMPRALLELENTAPDLKVYPFVIKTQLKWSSIALEYTKYVYSLARYRIF